MERIAQEQITRIVQRHGCREGEIEIRARTILMPAQWVGSRFVLRGPLLYTRGYIFRPLYSLGLQAIRVVGFAAELTVHDGSYRLLNVQLFLLATPGTLVVQAFPECESQTHSRRTGNHSMMVQAKHLQRDQE